MTTPEDASLIHRTLIDDLAAAGIVRSPSVEAALRAVPRHLFLPGVPLEEVYRDQAIVTKRVDGVGVSSSSQPAMMAIMLEQLDVQPGQRVLEIGAGTGYNAALLAHLVGSTGQVVTVDLDPDTVETARQHLDAAGFQPVQVICGDGGLGYSPGAPYDRIILTVGAWDIVPAWTEQLRANGRLVLPLALGGPETQRAIAFDRLDDHLVSVSVRPCGFMLLRGASAGPIQQVPLGPAPGMRLMHEHTGALNAGAVLSWLGDPSAIRPTGVHANSLTVATRLNLWLALHDSRFCVLSIDDGEAESPFSALALYGYGHQMRRMVGLLGERGLSLLSRTRDPQSVPDADEWAPESAPFELEVRSFGIEDGLGEDLLKLVQAWDASGLPSEDSLRVTVYPHDVDVATAGSELVISKRWTRLVLDWT
ncbi:MAG: methyltransferase, FxLD system [Chloroflexota bacterium]|nr:methyltransferase, FxLD system [Chloroflexota bacterium]